MNAEVTCDYAPEIPIYSGCSDPCYHPSICTCEDCGGEFCAEHSEPCDLCGKRFCISCLFEHEKHGAHTLVERVTAMVDHA